MTTQKLPSIELYYQEGSSDKVYRTAVEAFGDGFVVNFAYGRRGSTLTAGTKTQSPVPYDEAVSIYTKLVKSKTAKGYKPVEGDTGITNGGTGMVSAGMVREDTGLRAQLLNPIDSEKSAERYLKNDWWCAQEKHDGRRMLIRKSGGTITAANRRGQACGCPLPVHEALMAINGDFVLDGECVGDMYFVFDVLEVGGADLRGRTYMDRGYQLCQLLQDADRAAVVIVDTAFGTQEKRDMLERLRDGGREGIVFKELCARWNAGHPASGGPALKLKFWETCSCVVGGVNAKRSVTLELGGKHIGNVTIPPSHDIPEPGQVVEIRYLYVTGKGGALYQPVYLGVRDDVDPAECTPDGQHLKFKAA